MNKENEVKMRGVRISDNLWNKIRAQAASEHRTVGMHVIHILEKAVKEFEQRKVA